ncbi:MAG: TetR/AcrR family transcriptional regulator, partial [Actinomycetota bacterium]
MARPTGRPVRDELVTEARALIQQVGVSGFSYGDLADRLGISSPSIHHHFRTKEDLVAEVAARYRSDFAKTVAAIEAPSAGSRLAAYVQLYAETSTREM